MITRRTSTPAGTETEALSWLFTSSSTGAAAGTAIAGILAQGAGPGAVFACARAAGGLATLLAILGARHLGPPAPVAVRTAPAVV